MPTLKDIQEKKSEVMLLANTIFTNKASDSFQVLEMFIDKLTTLAYQAGIENEKERLLNQKANQHDEEVRKQVLDMVLKEIEGMERKDKWGDREGDGWAGCCGQEEIVGWNIALSYLKEKIISNSK